VQQLLDDPVQRTGNVGALLLGEFGPPRDELAQLRGDHLIRAGTQSRDGRRDVRAA
jgi:hypothetical protein